MKFKEGNDILVISNKLNFRHFCQKWLIDKYDLKKNGVCFGLVMEAARHHLRHITESDDLFYEKLLDKLDNKSDRFVMRVSEYQKFQAYPDIEIFSKANDTLDNLNTGLSQYNQIYNLLSSKDFNFKDSKYLGIGLFGVNTTTPNAPLAYPHVIGLQVSEFNNYKSYKIFDPNYGVSNAFNTLSDVAYALQDLIKDYEVYYYPDAPHYACKLFSIYDIERNARISLDLQNADNKFQKYKYVALLEAISRSEFDVVKDFMKFGYDKFLFKAQKFAIGAGDGYLQDQSICPYDLINTKFSHSEALELLSLSNLYSFEPILFNCLAYIAMKTHQPIADYFEIVEEKFLTSYSKSNVDYNSKLNTINTLSSISWDYDRNVISYDPLYESELNNFLVSQTEFYNEYSITILPPEHFA